LKSRSRLEIVVTFLAMLELIKRRMIDASQEQLFSEIEIAPLGDLEDTAELEVEFTE
jgi:segregation and condensation protein A